MNCSGTDAKVNAWISNALEPWMAVLASRAYNSCPDNRKCEDFMDSATLKAMQAPLKDAYRTDAATALITLRAKGSVDDQKIACKVETGRAIAEAGLHPATGGSGMELCSGDMLLEALVACAGVTLKAVATALEFRLRRRVCRGRGRPRFPRHARRVEGGARRFSRYPVAFRARNRRTAGAHRFADQADRALLRRVPDPQRQAGTNSRGKRRTPGRQALIENHSGGGWSAGPSSPSSSP